MKTFSFRWKYNFNLKQTNQFPFLALYRKDCENLLTGIIKLIFNLHCGDLTSLSNTCAGSKPYFFNIIAVRPTYREVRRPSPEVVTSSITSLQ